MLVKHSKVSAAGASPDPALVGGPDWNGDHVLTGLRPIAAFNGTYSGTLSATQSGGVLSRISTGFFKFALTPAVYSGAIGNLVASPHASLGTYPTGFYRVNYIFQSGEDGVELNIYIRDNADALVDPVQLHAVIHAVT